MLLTKEKLKKILANGFNRFPIVIDSRELDY